MAAMVKASAMTEFKPGDRCFAKLKGYPWWPSKVLKVKERISGLGLVKAYKVYFYGTHDEGTVNLDKMAEYTEENLKACACATGSQSKWAKSVQVQVAMAVKEIQQNVTMEVGNNQNSGDQRRQEKVKLRATGSADSAPVAPVKEERATSSRQQRDTEPMNVGIDIGVRSRPEPRLEPATKRVRVAASVENPDQAAVHQVWKMKELSLLSNNMLELLESGAHSDCKVKCDGREFLLHKNILKVRSPVFATMFSTDKNEVNETNISAAVLQLMLKYIYSAQLAINEIRFRRICELIQAAEKYKLENLKALCFECLADSISETNAGELASLAFRYSAPDHIKERILKFCSTNMEKLMKNDGFKNNVKNVSVSFLDYLKLAKLSE